MKFIRTNLFLLPCILLLCSSLFAERQVIDRIVAVVGEEVILASELANQMQMNVLQSGKQPRNTEEAEKLRDQTLDGMISDRLFLVSAKKDTTINVRPEDVDRALDDHINGMRQNFDTDEEFAAALAQEGLTVRELRKRFRSDVENQLIKQRYIQKKLYGVSVSRHEVEEFYQEFKDSIPIQPEAVKISHILLPFKVSASVEDSVKALAEELRLRVLGGTDFASLAEQYSSFGAGVNGGDLGFIARNDVVPEFSRAAFNLQPGDISGVIKTQFGYHIIKCEDQKGERLKLRHILLGVIPSAEDSARTMHLADSLITEIRNGGDFKEFAKVFSSDDDTRALGGELGWFSTDRLPSEFASAMANWTTPEEIRGPVKSQFGVHIIKLLEYRPAKEYTLEEDYDELKELARQDKTGKMVDEWIEDLKEKTYIDYRLEETP